MTQRTKKFHSLSKRIVLMFCLFTFIISVAFGGISLMLMYVIEDNFIEKDIRQEAVYLSAKKEETGKWLIPRSDNMQLHFSRDTFPLDFREVAIGAPNRKEFFGNEGRHYHVYPFENFSDTYLVAEVSSSLMVRQLRDGVLQFLVISGLIVTFTACLVAWLIARNATRPLQRLAELVDGVAPQHIPFKFAQDYPHNEVGILADKLEDTLSRIKQALDREKAFTRDASHELRTPLAVIKNAVELMLSQQSSIADKAVFTRIYNAADQMEKTVQTLLMLAREEHTSTAKSPTRLMPSLEQSIIDNRLLLENKQVDIHLDDTCDVVIEANEQMLKVLLDNLLGNAFKYTDSGEVSIKYENHTLCIQDTGPGIESNITDNVIEMGVKGEQSTGFGFGLAIVKRLCDHQGWDLIIKSSHGTTVTVTFKNRGY